MTQWTTAIAILLATTIVSASVLFTGRYQIAATAYGYSGGKTGSDEETDIQRVYRLDRWTGEIDECKIDDERQQKDGALTYLCPDKIEQ